MGLAMMREDVEEALVIEGEGEARQKVKAFIEKAAGSLEAEGELKITLSQAAKTGSMAVYETVYAFDETIEDLVAELVDKACEDAEHIGRGRIKYTVEVDGVKGRVTFSLKIPEREGEDEDDIDEVPNKRGLISQQMRHNETLVKVAVGASKETNEMLRSMLRDEQARTQRLEAKYMETMKAYEELLSMRQVRDIELRKVESQERRKDQVGHVLMQGLPILASKLLGGGQKQAVEMMGAKTPLEQMLEGFLMTMNHDQLAKIASSELFTPIQKAGLMEIISFVLERQAAEQEKVSGKPANGAGQSQQPQQGMPSGPLPTPQATPV